MRVRVGRLLLAAGILALIYLGGGSRQEVAAADYHGNTTLGVRDAYIFYGDCSTTASVAVGGDFKTDGAGFSQPATVVLRWEVLVNSPSGAYLTIPASRTAQVGSGVSIYHWDVAASPLFATLPPGSTRCILHFYVDPSSTNGAATFSTANIVVRLAPIGIGGSGGNGGGVLPSSSAAPNASATGLPTPTPAATPTPSHWTCHHGNSPRNCVDLYHVVVPAGGSITYAWSVNAASLDGNWTNGSRWEEMDLMSPPDNGSSEYFHVVNYQGNVGGTETRQLCRGGSGTSTPCSGTNTYGTSSALTLWFRCRDANNDFYYETDCAVYPRVFDSAGVEQKLDGTGPLPTPTPTATPSDPFASASADPTPDGVPGGAQGVDICVAHPGITACQRSWPPGLCSQYPGISACQSWPPASGPADLCQQHPGVLACWTPAPTPTGGASNNPSGAVDAFGALESDLNGRAPFGYIKQVGDALNGAAGNAAGGDPDYCMDIPQWRPAEAGGDTTAHGCLPLSDMASSGSFVRGILLTMLILVGGVGILRWTLRSAPAG
jgi:hypothetical protein